MTLLHYLYVALGSGLSLIFLPVVWSLWKNHKGRRLEFYQRLGYAPKKRGMTIKGRPRVWLHAVSVGEVKAAETVIRALDSLGTHVDIIFTTTTRTGEQYARQQLSGRATICFAPLDLWGSTGRFLTVHRPNFLVCMETELWPNWIVRAHRAGMKIAILNGRISSRSIRSYLGIRPLIKPALEKIDAFSMISKDDARRIRLLGAPRHRILINGNVKMDAQDIVEGGMSIDGLRRLYTVDNETPVFIAGSVRGEEAELLMDVFLRLSEKLPKMLFIIAPRHVENSKRIAGLAKANGIPWQYRTELQKDNTKRHASLVVLDTMGELRQTYAIATVVFCGASLVPLGGQNILEAASQAKPVLYGPFMEDFKEERKLIENWGGGLCVKDKNILADRALYLLTHTKEAELMGSFAKKAVLLNRGAALRHAEVLNRVITDS